MKRVIATFCLAVMAILAMAILVKIVYTNLPRPEPEVPVVIELYVQGQPGIRLEAGDSVPCILVSKGGE